MLNKHIWPIKSSTHAHAHAHRTVRKSAKECYEVFAQTALVGISDNAEVEATAAAAAAVAAAVAKGLKWLAFVVIFVQLPPDFYGFMLQL